jgi:hypothetical protein
MEQRALKNVNNCLNANIYSFLETSVVKILMHILLLLITLTPELIRNLWQLKTVVFLHVSNMLCPCPWSLHPNHPALCFNYFCKCFPFLIIFVNSFNVCAFYFCIFSNKLDLLDATCFIIQ